MEYNTNKTAAAASTMTTTPISPSSSASSPTAAISTAAAVMSPCAACKILRRRCMDSCVLAPYFPPTEPLKFTIAHKVFGASNVIKMLQELGEDERADAVNSIVYEAEARIRDPVYGCAGAVFRLQKQISELQAQLAKARAEVFHMQCHNSCLANLICMQTTTSTTAAMTSHFNVLQEQKLPYLNNNNNVNGSFLEDNYESLESLLWT